MDNLDMWFRLALAGLVIVLADRITKRIAASHLAKRRPILGGDWLRITCVLNPARRQPALLLVWLAAAAGITLALTSGQFFQTAPAQLGLGAALGGAASNLFDRLRCGAIIDFIDLGWWPVFNLADVAITLGAIAALWYNP